jgi:hypothetical protein
VNEAPPPFYWRLRFARLLVEQVATTDLRRLSQRRFERLVRRFGWLFFDDAPTFEMVLRPESEYRLLADGRRRHAKQMEEAFAAYLRVCHEGDRRVRRLNKRTWRRSAVPMSQRGRVLRARTPIVRLRSGRAPRLVVRVSRRSRRLALARRSDDDEPADGRVALGGGS